MPIEKEESNHKSSNSENNKRIAKNTLFLYIRSILTLGVGLYTSREVMAQLGVSDFGIYNVVGGVIVMFSFIQHAMNSATSRFFTFDLGKGDFEALKKNFSLSVIIHIFTALLILILGETIGLWFLNTKLVIPEDRMGAANFVYQFSVLSACTGILQVPYTVVINAHERMKIIAYFGIADAVFKLVIVLALGFTSFDKLKVYSVFLFIVYIIMFVFYQVYCHKNYQETHFKWFWDKKMFLERMGFGGWTIINGISTIAGMQGINMLLNMFHGVVLNATYGIMTQVSNAMNQFVFNFFTAINPQIIKSYASGNMEYLHSLLFRSMKFAFLLAFAIAFPLILNMDLILNIWLKEVPQYAVIFCQTKLIVNSLLIIPYPCCLSITATGKIKQYTIIDTVLIIQIFIFTYIFFKLGFPPTVFLIIDIIVCIARIIVSIILAKYLIKFSISEFIDKVAVKLLLIVLISVPLPTFISFNTENRAALFATSISFILLFLFSSIFIGLNKNERITIFNLIKNKFSHKASL